MADGYNRVILQGNLGADPELRHTSGGQPVLNLRMATTSSWFDKEANERKERVDWHSVVIWGARGEALSKILHKGSSLLVEGSLRSSSYDKNGEKHYKTEINAEEIVLTGGKPAAPAEAPKAVPSGKAATPAPRTGGGGGSRPTGQRPRQDEGTRGDGTPFD